METRMRYTGKRTAAFAVALLLGLSACDLDVVNENAADAERALRTGGDIEALIGGAFQQWWWSNHWRDGPVFILANQSFQMSSWPANYGMFFYSALSRVSVANNPTHEFYGNMLGDLWARNYRALFAVHASLRALADPENQAMRDELGEAQLRRARMFGKFVQGVAHGSLALFYQEAFILDENSVLTDASGAIQPQEPRPYNEVMTAALGYLDQAIQLAGETNPTPTTLPTSWISTAMGPAELSRVARQMKARLRASVARDPDERRNVAWDAVLADIAAVPEANWGWNLQIAYQTAPFFWDMAGHVGGSTAWGQVSYFVYGMADQSDNVRTWYASGAQAPESRLPTLGDGSPVLIHTPDMRFPQGATLDDQFADLPIRFPGVSISLRRQAVSGANVGANSWSQPARGTHRWSQYRLTTFDVHFPTGGADNVFPHIKPEEMRFLRAEAMIWPGASQDLAAAAALINETREAAGLEPANADGTSDHCVPRRPGPVGEAMPAGCPGTYSYLGLSPAETGLLEMLKWEKRMHIQAFGAHSNQWYFDGRGWGELYRGTQLAWPMPCLDVELHLAGTSCTTTGGGGDASAPLSVYAYPGE